MVISKFGTQRQPIEGEYIRNGIIYCKNCDTPRQTVIDEYYLPIMCKCEKLAFEKEREHQAKDNLERFREKCIPIAEYRKCRFEYDDGQTPKTKQLCERYVEKFEEMKARGLGLLFFGSKGTGKTFYEFCIANDLIDKGYSVMSTSLVSIIDEAMKTDDFFDDMVYKYMQRDLIIIDDIGTQRETGFAEEKALKFIDICYASRKPIIASTNLDINDMQAEVEGKLTHNSRLYDRLLERCYPVRLTSVNRRAKNREQNRKEVEKILGI